MILFSMETSVNGSGLRPVVHRFALLNDPDFLNQIVTRFLQQFLEAEIITFLQAEPYLSSSSGIEQGSKRSLEIVWCAPPELNPLNNIISF